VWRRVLYWGAWVIAAAGNKGWLIIRGRGLACVWSGFIF
jgi:hypothetical protein